MLLTSRATSAQPQRSKPQASGLVRGAADRLSLDLSVDPGTWRMLDSEHVRAERRYRAAIEAVWKRDRCTCRACGFTSKRFMEVTPRDGNHANGQIDNLVTVCPLCHLSFHMGRAGICREAVLIWLPEISQADINNIMRAAIVAARFDGVVADHARILQGDLARRTQVAEHIVGTSRPEILGQAILNLTSDALAQVRIKLAGVRLLWTGCRKVGARDIGPDMVAYWASREGPFRGHEPDAWRGLFSRLVVAADA